MQITIHDPEYPCYVRVNAWGALCGYIAIPQGHPWHGSGYDDIDVQVHGGLTYAQPRDTFGPEAPVGSWVLGFDCCHAGDGIHEPGEKRSRQYVRDELESLRRQAGRAARAEG